MSAGRGRARSVLAYAWAGPNTLLGLIVGGLTLFTGGTSQRREGTIEFCGGFSRALLESRLLAAGAVTLGHVILGRDARNLDACRAHEHGHVRQAELLGPFFLPAYVAAGLWAAVRHGEHYRANWFEGDADRRARATPTARAAAATDPAADGHGPPPDRPAS